MPRRMRFSIPPYGKLELSGASWIHVEGGDLPHPMSVRLGVRADGQLVATGVVIDADEGVEVTTRDLRLSLAQILSEFAATVARPSEKRRLYGELHGHPEFADDERFQQWSEDHPGSAVDFLDVGARLRAVKRPGRRGWSDDHYREVAKAYRRAWREHPRAPIRALMEEFGSPGSPAPESTVHRWIRTARAKGFLKEES
jgi:hypothetical protein